MNTKSFMVIPPGSPLERVLARLKRVRPCGNGYCAVCPAHDDKRPSLAIAVGVDGKVLIYCHAGCETRDVLAAIGLTFADLFPQNRHGRR